jgi:mono/diheme cytochrome c family protein
MRMSCIRLTLYVMTPLALSVPCQAQNVANVVKQGEAVFSKTCATGYCHGIRGGPSGAPRLAARGFDQAYISKVVTQGVPDTGMASFSSRLSPPDLVAVIAYVATLNGIANPDVSMDGAGDAVSSRPTLTGEAARGTRLFSEAVRGFGRCSTCHEVGGFGIPVAAPLAKVPASTADLKALATPDVKTGSMGGESMPVLVLSQGKQETVFYDLTSAPPVQRNAEPGSVKFTDGSKWRHSSVIGAYNDSELAAILDYLRAVIKP